MWLNNCIFSAGYIWNQLENGKLFYHNYTKRMVFNIFKVGVLLFSKGIICSNSLLLWTHY